MRVAFACVLAGCTFHNRIATTTTISIDDGSVGGDAVAETALGEGALLIVAGAAGHVGHELDGVSLLAGAELHRVPSPWGGRLGVTAGPALLSGNTTLEVRGGLAVVRGFARHTSELEETLFTVGLELFVSNIGLAGDGTLAGVGLTVGRMTLEQPRRPRAVATR